MAKVRFRTTTRAKPGRDRQVGRSSANATAPASLEYEAFLDDHELAARWGCSPKTLRNQRSRGEGPNFVRLGRLVRYRMSDLLAYEAAHAQFNANTVEADR